MEDRNLLQSIQRWEYEGGRLLPVGAMLLSARQMRPVSALYDGDAESQKPNSTVNNEAVRANNR